MRPRGRHLGPRLGAAGALALAGALSLGGLLPAASPVALAGDAPAPASAPADLAALEKVRGLLREGNRAGALEAAKALVAASPSDVEAHLLYQDAARGQVATQVLLTDYQGRATREPGGSSAFLLSRLQPAGDAEKTLRDALGRDAKSYWAQVGLASALARQGKAVQAEVAALAAMDLRSGDARAASRAGSQCAEARRFASAETCFRKALASDPAFPGAVMGLSHALLRQGKLDDAQTAFATLPPERQPSASRLLFAAALASEKGDAVAAEEALKKVLALSSGDTDAQVQLSLLRLRKVEAAALAAGKKVETPAIAADLASLQKCALALPDRGDIRYALGYAREISGDSDGALSDYREAARLDPLDGDSIAAVGAILLGKGLLDDAGREFLHALDRDPDDGVALANLAYVYDQQGKTKEALEIYQHLVKQEPTNARAWHGLGLALDAAGKAKDALTPLQKATELAPAVTRFLRDYGEALFFAKRFDKAEEVLAKVVAADPKDDDAWDALGRARDQQRKYAEALAAYEKVGELREKDKDVHLLMGALYQEFQKDYEKAIAHYNKYLALGGDAGDCEDWIAECQAEIDRKKN